jgi:hypothetical protein
MVKKNVKRPVGRPRNRIALQEINDPEIVAVTRSDLDAMVEKIVEARIAARNGVNERPRFVRIERHTDQQLNDAINGAVTKIKDFWVILHGIDAYIERRKRRNKATSGWKDPFFHEQQP